jgi:NADPH:quinone reductase-like Zn-dependent oxidoreductase
LIIVEKSMKYKSIVVTGRGGPEVLKMIENELRPPAAGEVRIKILASPVCQDDVAVRVGNRPFPAKPPFTPATPSWGWWTLLERV